MRVSRWGAGSPARSIRGRGTITRGQVRFWQVGGAGVSIQAEAEIHCNPYHYRLSTLRPGLEFPTFDSFKSLRVQMRDGAAQNAHISRDPIDSNDQRERLISH